MAFGGLLALDGVDLDVVQGERLGLLGPNGAGKTTLFNVISGDLRPTSGTVHVQGVDCTHLAARHRTRLGLARTYQRTRLFGGLTVGDNLYLAEAGRRGRHRTLWKSSVDHRMRERAAVTAERVWLASRFDSPVADLSHGERRQLEVGMAMAADPSVLLLDEPASGLSRGERDRLTELLAGLPDDMTLVLIEHDMDVALNTARRVVMMADGRIVASGSTEEIRNDPLVHEIYLGRGAGT
jgi:branched-chain amino acid transport system ATP-binding protein